MLCNIKTIVHTLPFQAHIPATYWVETLYMTSYLVNILPSTSINNKTPYYRLHKIHPIDTHLRVFGCLCFLYLVTPHKLSPCTSPGIFLGQLTNHHGYRCLDLSTLKIKTSQHVIFDDISFTFQVVTPNDPPSYTFLDYTCDSSHLLRSYLNSSSPMEIDSPWITHRPQI